MIINTRSAPGSAQCAVIRDANWRGGVEASGCVGCGLELQARWDSRRPDGLEFP